MQRPYRLFLAGRIQAEGDWRQEIVHGLRPIEDFWGEGEDWEFKGFPVLERSVWRRFDYTGPYFVRGHDDVDLPARDCNLSEVVLAEQMHAIGRCDLLFAWLTDPNDVDVLASIYCATGLQIARPRSQDAWQPGDVGFGDHPDVLICMPKDLMDQARCRIPSASALLCPITDRRPVEALRRILFAADAWFDSPLERTFYMTSPEDRKDELTPQYPMFAGRYFIDFAHLTSKTAIELDGFTYHRDEAAFARDRKRDRELMAEGWQVIRFASKEMFGNPQRCVEQAWTLIDQRLQRK